MDGYGYEQRSERRGGGYSRDGGNRSHPYTQDRGSGWRSYGSRGGGGGGGDYGGEKSNMFVDQTNVGRIIGKKGSKIRQLEEDSGATIKVYSDQMENGKCKVVLIGDGESRRCAEDLIRGVEESFYNGDSRGGGGSYGGGRYGGGGGGYGGGRGGRDYDGGSRGRSSTCYQCGKEGHFARDCPEQSGY